MKLRSLCILMIILPFTASAQNVGIGIDTPQAKLHVNGNFKLRNDVGVNGISGHHKYKL